LEDIDQASRHGSYARDPGPWKQETSSGWRGRINAAKDSKRALLEAAAKEFGVKPEEMDIKNKKAFVKANPEMSIPWARLVRMACYTTPGIVIIGRGQSSRGISTYGLAVYYRNRGHGTNYSFTASQEVEVDLETGVKCTDVA
jgi:CO/xanthine dehydrogenase Mo-binding subunit